MTILRCFGMLVQCLCAWVLRETPVLGSCDAPLVSAFRREVTSLKALWLTACAGGADQGVKKEALLFGQKLS